MEHRLINLVKKPLITPSEPAGKLHRLKIYLIKALKPSWLHLFRWNLLISSLTYIVTQSPYAFILIAISSIVLPILDSDLPETPKEARARRKKLAGKKKITWRSR